MRVQWTLSSSIKCVLKTGSVTPQTEEGSIGWGAEEVAQPASGSVCLCGAWTSHWNLSPAFFPYPKMSLPVLKSFFKSLTFHLCHVN